MNIVILGPYYPYRGGISDTNQELFENLINAGHNVQVINFKLQYPSLFFPGKMQYITNYNNTIKKSIRIINTINPFNWLYVAKKINELAPDLLINSYWSPYFSPCFSLINRMLNKQIVKIGLIHNAFPHEKIIFQKEFLKFYINSIDKYVCFSETVKNQIHSLIPKKKGKTIYHPIHRKFGNPIEQKKARKKLNLKNNVIYILFFGTIRAYKGLDILLKSMQFVFLKEKKVELLIVGENYESLNKYSKFLNNPDYKNKIHLFNNYIDDDELKYWFSASDLVIQPYKRSSQSGITPLTFQFEVPTITTNVGGLSEQIKNNINGFICEPNHQDLSNKITFALNFDKNIMLREIKRQKEKLNWIKFIKSLLNW